MFCSNCGEGVLVAAKFCTNCGNKLGTGDSKGEEPVLTTKFKDKATGLFDHLSPEAQKSLNILKKKYGRPSLSEYVLFVNFMSNDKKVFRKIGGNGATLELTVSVSSTSSTWKEMIGQKLVVNCNMERIFFVLKKDGEEIHTLKDVIYQQKRNHRKHLMVYAVLPNKRNKLVINYKKAEEKKTVVAAGCDAEEESTMITVSDSSGDSGDDFLELKPSSTTSNVKQQVTTCTTEVEPQEVQPNNTEDEPKACCSTSSVSHENNSINVDETHSSVQLPLDVINEESEDNELEESEDHELEKFRRVQEKLVERKQEAAQRIQKVKNSQGKKENYCIFYTSRNNVGLSFKAPIDADIGFLYDMICHLLDADTSAPKFHLVGEDQRIFMRSFKGKLCEVPKILHLIEEDFQADDTITNFDDVIF